MVLTYHGCNQEILTLGFQTKITGNCNIESQ